MLDAHIRPAVNAVLDPVAGVLARRGVTATSVTITGFGLGLAGAGCVVIGEFTVALALICINRICDGLDGVIARQTAPTDFGGYLDIVLDFIFYSAIPFAFALYDPEFGRAAAFLIFSFIGTGVSFLAYAIMVEKSNLPGLERASTGHHRGNKSFYHLGGLTEGTETIILLAIICLWPASFAYLAWVFGALCWITTATRIHAAAQLR